MTEIKNNLRATAGVSLATPWLGGEGKYMYRNKDSTQDALSTAGKNMDLAWTACGGDTTLCGSPAHWVQTVKKYKLWRVVEVSFDEA